MLLNHKSKKIDYNHPSNAHNEEGPKVALAAIFENKWPTSLLDVGCGTGAWLKAGLNYGIADVLGIDGVAIPADLLLIPSDNFRCQDLTQEWKLDRRFDVALCLEVAEHLDPSFAEHLINNLTIHSNLVIFSAACPDQRGQHHVNCQWPAYWQEHFNTHGFVCNDSIRWKLWDEPKVEAWYRQNLFIATREPLTAGKEPRLRAVAHPCMLPFLSYSVNEIENGSVPIQWYIRTSFKALSAKINRRIGK